MSDIFMNDDIMTSVNISITPLNEANEQLTEERKAILGISSQPDEALTEFIATVKTAMNVLIEKKGV